MKKCFITLCCLIATYLSSSQSTSKEYLELIKKGQSLYKAKDYKNSAIAYSAALRLHNGMPNINDQYSTACSWSLANYPDSAFNQLNIIANSRDFTFSEFNDIMDEEDFTGLHNDKRWQNLKDKMFSNAKNTFYSEANSGEKITIPSRYDAAEAWALINNPDSSFANLQIIANTKDNTIVHNLEADEALSILHNDKRWLPVVDAIYRNAANTLASRIRSGTWTNPTLDGFDAARAWALAKEPDSAFYYLDKIVNTNYNAFTNYNQLTNTPAFSALRNDKRWQQIVETVKKNFVPNPCGHTFFGPALPMSFTIDPTSSFLKSDGKGTYLNGVDKVSSLDQHAYNFLLSGKNPGLVSYDKNDVSPRSLTLDLNSPVAGSGSVAMGVIQDRDAAFHIFYKFDSTVKPKLVYDFREIPVGSTIESPRSGIDIHIKNVLYKLQLGPWGLGDCVEDYSHGGRLNGNGTTMVKIIRNSESTYTIIAPEGTIGRLWNTQNMSMPVDMGLFQTGFIIHLKYQ